MAGDGVTVPTASKPAPILVPNAYDVHSIAPGLPVVKVHVTDAPLCLLVDTGASINLCSEAFLSSIPHSIEPCNLEIRGISSQKLLLTRKTTLPLKFQNLTLNVDFFVHPHSLSNQYSAILGFNFLQEHNLTLFAEPRILKGPQFQLSYFLTSGPQPSQVDNSCKAPVNRSSPPVLHGVLPRKVNLPPFSENMVRVKVSDPHLKPGDQVLAVSCIRSRTDVLVANCVSRVTPSGHVLIKAANFSEVPVTLNKGMKLVTIESFEEVPGSDSNPVNTTDCDIIPDDLPEDFETWGGDLDLDHLNPEERAKFLVLLEQYPNLFAKSVKDLGGCGTLYHRIHLKDSIPVRQKPYRVPYHLREELDRQIAELLEAGIIQESETPYSAPVLLVRKGDGSYRLVTDFRRLNEKTIRDNFPLPNMVELVDNLSGAQFFSSLDMTSGYFQLYVHPDDVDKCGFSTHSGHYTWKRLPFGLSNAPSSFSRLMQIVLANLHPLQIAIYLDDIVVASKTFEEHLHKLQILFDRLSLHNLKLKPSKCNFIKREIKYLGFRVSEGIVSPDPSNLETVKSFKIPQNRKQVRQFLGLTGFYRRFIENYSKKALPLTQLTKINLAFKWSDQAQEAFDILKEELLKEPVLVLPNFEEPFTLCTDASKFALGAVLCQTDKEGHLHPICYGSRKLKPAETRYSTVERETLGVVWGTAHFRHYLLGKPFKIYCDQASLSHVLKLKDPTSRIARWIMSLSQYDYSIVYHPGKLNLTADYLSRAVNVVETIETSVGASLRTRIANLQPLDVKCSRLINLIDKKLDPNPKNLIFFLKDGILFCTSRKPRNRFEALDRIVVPATLTDEVISLSHSDATSAHPGLSRTLNRLRQLYYWPGMFSQVRKFVLGCPSCIGKRGHIKNPLAPLQRIPVASRPLERCAMDAVGPLVTSLRGNKYIIALTDYFTRFPEAYPVPNIQSLMVVQVLEDFISRHGVPETLITDRGTNFLSAAISAVYEKLGIHKIHTSAFHPSSDGAVERLNGVLISSLSHLVSKTQEDWCRHVSFALLAHRTSRHSATGENPAYLMYGRDLNLPTQLLANPPTRTYSDTREFVDDLTYRLQMSFQQVKESLTRAAEKQEAYRARVAVDKNIQVGDLVYAHFPAVAPGTSKKLAQLNKGPFQVTRVLSRVNFELSSVENPAHVIRLHADRIIKPRVGSRWVVLEEKVPDGNSTIIPGPSSQVSIEPDEPEIEEVPRASSEIQSSLIPHRRPGPYNLRPRNEQGFVQVFSMETVTSVPDFNLEDGHFSLLPPPQDSTSLRPRYTHTFVRLFTYVTVKQVCVVFHQEF